MPSQRCFFENCNRKLKMSDFKCFCQNIFCIHHRLPEEHNCNFDFKTRDRENLKKSIETNISKVNNNSL
jgi:predicted nucleic acid binding AN1-type Zn finger protein